MVAGWLRRTSPTPAAAPFCVMLVDALQSVSQAIDLDLSDIQSIRTRYAAIPCAPSTDLLPPSEVLRGQLVAIVGGRPSTFNNVRDVLLAEDEVSKVVHVPAGDGTSARAEAVLGAHWIVFVTTYIGHDDVAAVESLLRRRRASGQIVRLPNRRDGARSIVQLLRRAVATGSRHQAAA